MKYALVIAVIIVQLIIIGSILRAYFKVKKEKDKYKRISENYSDAAVRVEENIKKANDEKKKLNTGDNYTNAANATDIMSNIANKRSKS